MASIFTRRPRFFAHAGTPQTPQTSQEPPTPPLLPTLPPLVWPDYKAPLPSYWFEGREQKQHLIDEASQRVWFHNIDLGGGYVTKGLPDAAHRHIQQSFLDTDFTGKKVLDIGCWDGLWSFEAEKRGADEVYAIDLVTQRGGDSTTFELAREILNSRVKYFPNISVYDIHELGVDDFDIILYQGVFYHIKDPLLALARLRQVAKIGGLILVEGEVKWSDQSYAEFYYNKTYSQCHSNWWIPTIPCLREWIECSSFVIEKEFPGHDGIEGYWLKRHGYDRTTIKARAVPVPARLNEDPKNFFSRYDFLER
jgi:tRNA (mo5U34)-methyltransferase